MTWRDLLLGSSTKAPPPVAPAATEPTIAAPPDLEPEPAPVEAATGAKPKTTTSPVGTPTPPANNTTTSASISWDPPKLPPSPRSSGNQRDETTKPPEMATPGAVVLESSNNNSNGVSVPVPVPVPVKTDPNSPDARWEPPTNGFLLHHSKPPLKPISTWFIDESFVSNQQTSTPKATSPVKESFRARLEAPSSVDRAKARLLFSQDFMEGIERLEEERKKVESQSQSSWRDKSLLPEDSHSGRNSNIHVFVRKKPLCPKDIETGDYDVVRTESDDDALSPSVVVYNTELQHDLRKKEVKPAIFGVFQSCFSEQCDSGKVYQRSVKSLVETAKSGGTAALLLFGQSRSGKSYTIATVEGMAARDIFTGLPLNYSIRVTMVQLCGNQCLDLMDESPSTVRIADDPDGSVRFVNALSKAVSTPEDLLEAIVSAKKRARGRSHHICRITTVPPPDAPACIRRGTLLLVDCAGIKQRRSGSSSQQQANFSEIDASVRALKECLRAKTTSKNGNSFSVNYGASALTRCLRESMEREDATLHVIATVSSKATDTEDTMDTLSAVSNLMGGFPADIQLLAKASFEDNGSVPTPPKGWNHSQLCDWLLRKHLIHDAAGVPRDINGRVIMRMTKKELQATLYGKESEKADLLYRCLRAEMDRLARLEVKRRMAQSRKGN